MTLAIETTGKCVEMTLAVNEFIHNPSEGTYDKMMVAELDLFEFTSGSGDEFCLELATATIRRGIAKLEAAWPELLIREE
jgi:hypothetical protein